MRKLTALQNTWLKKSPEQSILLLPSQKLLVPHGKIYFIDKILGEDQNHYHVRLGYGAGDWYIFKLHFNLKEEKKDTTKRKTNEAGIKILHHFESLRLISYLCPSRKPTIGWGCTYYEDGTPVQLVQSITKERADSLFLYVLGKFETDVDKAVKVPLTSNQFSALVCFAFNVGSGYAPPNVPKSKWSAFERSTLLLKLNNSDYIGASNQFGRWVKGGTGQVLPGLERRREAEKQLFMS